MPRRRALQCRRMPQVEVEGREGNARSAVARGNRCGAVSKDRQQVAGHIQRIERNELAIRCCGEELARKGAVVQVLRAECQAGKAADSLKIEVVDDCRQAGALVDRDQQACGSHAEQLSIHRFHASDEAERRGACTQGDFANSPPRQSGDRCRRTVGRVCPV